MSEEAESICPRDELEIQADEEYLEELYSKRSLNPDELRIVLIGKTGSGKSSTGNTITGKNMFMSMQSALSVTEICHNVTVERFGRPLQVVDTPGLFDTNVDHEHIYKEIKKCVLITSPGIHAIILVTKLGRFTEEEKKTVEYFRKVFGNGIEQYLMTVFTGKDDLDVEGNTIETYVRKAPQPLLHFLHESGNRYMALNNRAQEDEKDAFAQQLIFNIDEMVRSNGGTCYTTEMFRKAEAMVKKREEEERKKKEEEKRKEREAIENSIKEQYDVVIKEQDNKMQNLQKDLVEVQQKAKEEQKRHEDATRTLKAQLDKADAERKQTEIDMRKREDELRRQMQSNEEMNKRIMTSMEESNRRSKMKKLTEDAKEERRQRENESKKREEELKKREKELKKREEESKKREEESKKREEELKKLRVMPYRTSLDGGLKHQGKTSQFFFNLTDGSSDRDDVGFHFSARFNDLGDRNKTVRNSRINMDWKNEERSQPNFPFVPQVIFSIHLVVEESRIRVVVNGVHFIDFQHRFWPISRMNYLHIYGDVTLEKVDTV